MAIARLAETLGADNTATPYNISVAAPASTPNAVCVVIVQSGTGGNVDNVTSVSYGSVPLTERRFQVETTEPGAVWIYWAAGVAFPSGAQTVAIVRTGSVQMRAAVCPMTCAAGQQVAVDVDTFGTSAATDTPTWLMTTTVAPTECYLGIHSGLNAMTTTPATNWTLIGSDDIGNFGRGWARRTMASAGQTTPGWNANLTNDDYVGISIAFKEIPLTAAVPPILVMPPMG